MAAPKKPDYFTVSTSFFGSFEGGSYEYLKGEVIAADDPALKRWPEYFVPLEVKEPIRSSKPVEQATAAPGEQRGGKALTTASLKGK